MNSALAFDSLAYLKKLMLQAFRKNKLEVQAETLAELVNEQIVSKQYLDIRLTETALRLKYDLTLRFGTMLAASVAIIAALIKLL